MKTLLYRELFEISNRQRIFTTYNRQGGGSSYPPGHLDIYWSILTKFGDMKL